MSIVFKRYDVSCTSLDGIEEDAEGEYVKAQDAYDKCAALSAEITTLKAQLKDYQDRERIRKTATFALAYGASEKTIEQILRST